MYCTVLYSLHYSLQSFLLTGTSVLVVDLPYDGTMYICGNLDQDIAQAAELIKLRQLKSEIMRDMNDEPDAFSQSNLSVAEGVSDGTRINNVSNNRMGDEIPPPKPFFLEKITNPANFSPARTSGRKSVVEDYLSSSSSESDAPVDLLEAIASVEQTHGISSPSSQLPATATATASTTVSPLKSASENGGVVAEGYKRDISSAESSETACDCSCVIEHVQQTVSVVSAEPATESTAVINTQSGADVTSSIAIDDDHHQLQEQQHNAALSMVSAEVEQIMSALSQQIVDSRATAEEAQLELQREKLATREAASEVAHAHIRRADVERECARLLDDLIATKVWLYTGGMVLR
jgi:hypothetical protein